MKVSALQSFLGWVGETNADLIFWLANLETRQLKDAIVDTSIDRPIFICGLARAGTTILLELLAQHPDTGTFRYQDFSFPMLPTWWDKMNGASNSTPVERSHKDRINVTCAVRAILNLAQTAALSTPATAPQTTPSVYGSKVRRSKAGGQLLGQYSWISEEGYGK